MIPLLTVSLFMLETKLQQWLEQWTKWKNKNYLNDYCLAILKINLMSFLRCFMNHFWSISSFISLHFSSGNDPLFFMNTPCSVALIPSLPFVSLPGMRLLCLFPSPQVSKAHHCCRSFSKDTPPIYLGGFTQPLALCFELPSPLLFNF